MTNDPAGTRTPERFPERLSRNRNYNILWSGQVLSSLGNEILIIGIPLLILATSGSPVEMGLAASAVGVARIMATIPAGVVADRFDRKRILLVCQGVRTLTFTGFVVALAMGWYVFPVVLAVAAIEGVLSALFDPTEDALLPQVVRETQLSTAIARNTARDYLAGLIGPALGGLLYTASRSLPFVATAVMNAVSFVLLLFLRPPPAVDPPAPAGSHPRSVLSDVVAGFRWVVGQRVILLTMVWIMAVNLVIGGLIIVILFASGEEQRAAGEIGFMMSFFGAGGLLGAALAARMYSVLPTSVIIIGFSWTAAGLTALMAAVPSGIPLGLLLGGIAFFAPVVNTAIMTYQMVITPNELRGRLSSIVGLCTGVASAIGPMVAGILISALGVTRIMLVSAAVLAVVALLTTLLPTFRRFPKIDPEELEPAGPDPMEHQN